MSDILLMYPYVNDITAEVAGMLPPLGLSYISSYILQFGYKSEIIDCSGQGIPYSSIPSIVKNKNPKIIGISSTTPVIHRAIELAYLLKSINRNILIVLGGSHVSVLGEELLEEVNAVDIIVKGEGEITFTEILDMHIRQQIKIEDIKGISYRNKEKIVSNPPRPNILNIDLIPFPSREVINYPNYRMPTKWNFKGPFATVITSRGCPFLCKFCYVHKMFGRKVRFRSVDNIIKELKVLIQNFGIKDIIFYDDTLTLNKERIVNLCNRILIEKINISWGCYSRVDTIDEDIVQIMKKAGCRMISFGVESGSDEILKRMGKGITVEDSINAISICNKHKIETSVSVLVGFPGETVKTIIDTKQFLKRLDPLFVSIFRLIPYPGTILFNYYLEQVGKKKLLISDFEKINESYICLKTISNKNIINSLKKMYIVFYMRPKKLKDHLIRTISNAHLLKGYFRAMLWVINQKMKI